MPLQSTIPQYPLLHHHHHHHHVSLSSTLSYSRSFPTVFGTSSFLRTVTAYNKNQFVRFSISQVHSNGTVDYERRPAWKWTSLYRTISLMKEQEMDVASVLRQFERDGKMLTKWETRRIIKKLRKFRRYNLALEVCEWMYNREDRFEITTSDTAIQLDLVAKLHGPLVAEDYFVKLPDTSKDKRTYGALLNVYSQAKMKEKAVSLIEEMRIRGYPVNSLECNVMMTLYMNLKEYDKVDLVVSDMRLNNIPLDMYSYNIWLLSSGSQGSVEKMEQVFEQIELDSIVNPNWITFSTMASLYIKGGQLEKAEDCIKNMESRITGQDRVPYHHLISLYGSVGKREEVYRVWNVFKSKFQGSSVMGFHHMISSLVRLGDIEGAEQVYLEWLSGKPTGDFRIANLLLSCYVRNGLFEKAESLFEGIVELGGKPSPNTWEILAEMFIKEKRITQALSCLKEAVLISQSSKWKPRPVNVCSILNICEKNDDTESKVVLMDLLSQVGCLEDEAYMSFIPLDNGVAAGGVRT